MITKMGDSAGRVHLHTHKGDNAGEIAEALRPYVGRYAWFYPANAYGHVNPHKATYGLIEGVDGTSVSVYVPRTGYRGVVDAFEGFGHYGTTVEAAREDAPAYLSTYQNQIERPAVCPLDIV